MQGDSADSMLQWVLSQRGQEASKDPNLAKEVTLAVLRHVIPNPKVRPLACFTLAQICGQLEATRKATLQNATLLAWLLWRLTFCAFPTICLDSVCCALDTPYQHTVV